MTDLIQLDAAVAAAKSLFRLHTTRIRADLAAVPDQTAALDAVRAEARYNSLIDGLRAEASRDYPQNTIDAMRAFADFLAAIKGAKA